MSGNTNPFYKNCHGNAPPPGSYTHRVAIEVTALSEAQGAELLVFPGTGERRRIGAVQPRTVEKLSAAHVGLVGSVGETCA